ncbi:MAG: ABC transporter permease subunit [Granulosicoccus sp.]
MKLIVIATDEVLRLFSTRRGFLSITGFCLIWLAVLHYGVMPAARLFSGAAESGLADMILPEIGLSGVRLWPSPELSVFWVVSLYLLPFLAIMTAADQTASDRARGTLRYLVLRCSRLEIFFGRYIGQLFILLLVVLVTLISVLAVVAINSSDRLAAAVATGPVIVVNLMLVLAPYVALMALVSVLASTARQATIYAVVIWIAVSLLVSILRSKMPDANWLDWALPGSQIDTLIGLTGWQTLSVAAIPIVHTFVLLLVGVLIMRRRDL